MNDASTVTGIPMGSQQSYIQWSALSPVRTRFWVGDEYDETLGGGTDTAGYFAQSQETNTTTRLVYNRNNTLQSITVPARASLTTSSASMSLLNYGTSSFYVNSFMSTAYISDYLNSTEFEDMRTIILNFNTTLGR
jgi:hypothetical protein